MPLTKATPEVIDVDKLTVNLKSNTLADGIRDYVDDTVTTTITSLTGLINAESGTRSAAISTINTLLNTNGIGVPLSTNTSLDDLNTLGTTGKYWIENTNTNLPPGMTFFVLEVVAISESVSVQFAKNGNNIGHRVGTGGTLYAAHTWGVWSIFENTNRLTQEITDRGNADNAIIAMIDGVTDYTYITEHLISSGTTTIDIAPKRGCRFFLLGAGGGGSTKGNGESSDYFGVTGTPTTIAVDGTTVIVSAGGGTGAGNGYYRYVQGPAGTTGVNTINRDYARYLTIINNNRAFMPTAITNTLGKGSAAVDVENPNQGAGNVGGDGALCDGIFYNTGNTIITITISIGVGGAHVHPSGLPGTDGYAVIYT